MTTMTNATCEVIALDTMTDHGLCMECNPPYKPEDQWFAPLYCDTVYIEF